MIQAVRPTSKATLKMQCLMVCKGDIDEAAKLYDYFARDMPALPDYDTPPPTWLDNTKDVAGGIVGWLGQNKDTLAQGYEILRAITGNRLPPAARASRRAAAAHQPVTANSRQLWTKGR